MRLEDQERIRKLQIFSQAREETFQSLIGPGFFQSFPPGVILVKENAMQDFLFILVEGQVEMYATLLFGNYREDTEKKGKISKTRNWVTVVNDLPIGFYRNPIIARQITTLIYRMRKSCWLIG